MQLLQKKKKKKKKKQKKANHSEIWYLREYSLLNRIISDRVLRGKQKCKVRRKFRATE